MHKVVLDVEGFLPRNTLKTFGQGRKGIAKKGIRSPTQAVISPGAISATQQLCSSRLNAENLALLFLCFSPTSAAMVPHLRKDS